MRKPPTAYVIEDQAALSMLYSDSLRLVGFNVESFRHGFEAINKFEVSTDVPALILLDINLPGATGNDILKHIRRKEHLKDVPVMVVTANSVMANKIKAELGEHDALYIKPVGMKELQDFARKLRPPQIKTGTLNPDKVPDSPAVVVATVDPEAETIVNRDVFQKKVLDAAPETDENSITTPTHQPGDEPDAPAPTDI